MCQAPGTQQLLQTQINLLELRVIIHLSSHTLYMSLTLIPVPTPPHPCLTLALTHLPLACPVHLSSCPFPVPIPFMSYSDTYLQYSLYHSPVPSIYSPIHVPKSPVYLHTQELCPHTPFPTHLLLSSHTSNSGVTASLVPSPCHLSLPHPPPIPPFLPGPQTSTKTLQVVPSPRAVAASVKWG